MSAQNRRFTNKQVAAIVVALCLGLGLAPAGAVAANQAFSIADPVHGSHKARVSPEGALKVYGSVQAVTPTATWSFTNSDPATYYNLTPPKDVPIDLSTLYIGGDDTLAHAYLGIYAATAPSSATTGCKDVGVSPRLIWQVHIDPDPVSVTFAAPLRTVPPAGKKVCLYAYLYHEGNAIFDVNGYYG
jgi:hypothetical protein